MSRAPLSRRRKLAFAAVAFLIPLFLAEVMAQVLYAPDYIYLDDEEGETFRFKPRAVLAEFGGMSLNDRGLHDVDRQDAKPDGVFRIVAIGDSFTFGNTFQPETIPAQMEAKIGAPQVEVHNLGMLAYGTDEATWLLKQEGLRRSPDLVVLFFYVGNDVRDNYKKNDRRVVHGKLFRGGQAHWRRRLLRSSALFRMADDGILFPKPGLPEEMAERAEARQEKYPLELISITRGLAGKYTPETFEQVMNLYAAEARAIAIDTELLDEVDESLWLERERQAVAAAEESVRAPFRASPFEGKEVADAVYAALQALEAKAEEERRAMVLGRLWMRNHVRFAPILWSETKDPKHETGWALTEQYLQELRDLCASQQISLRVVVLPAEYQVDERARRELLEVLKMGGSEVPALDFEAPQRRVLAVLEKLGVPALDVTSACAEADKGTRLYYKANTHFNAAGNALVADEVVRWLKAEGALPE